MGVGRKRTAAFLLSLAALGSAALYAIATGAALMVVVRVRRQH